MSNVARNEPRSVRTDLGDRVTTEFTDTGEHITLASRARAKPLALEPASHEIRLPERNRPHG